MTPHQLTLIITTQGATLYLYNRRDKSSIPQITFLFDALQHTPTHEGSLFMIKKLSSDLMDYYSSKPQLARTLEIIIETTTIPNPEKHPLLCLQYLILTSKAQLTLNALYLYNKPENKASENLLLSLTPPLRNSWTYVKTSLVGSMIALFIFTTLGVIFHHKKITSLALQNKLFCLNKALSSELDKKNQSARIAQDQQHTQAPLIKSYENNQQFLHVISSIVPIIPAGARLTSLKLLDQPITMTGGLILYGEAFTLEDVAHFYSALSERLCLQALTITTSLRSPEKIAEEAPFIFCIKNL